MKTIERFNLDSFFDTMLETDNINEDDVSIDGWNDLYNTPQSKKRDIL